MMSKFEYLWVRLAPPIDQLDAALRTLSGILRANEEDFKLTE
jgi:hypothetical protein